MDRQTDRQTDGHIHHTIIRPVIDGRIKTTNLTLNFCHKETSRKIRSQLIFKGIGSILFSEELQKKLYKSSQKK
jgi:hypothetical protein